MIVLTKAQADLILSHARAQLPEEACGILAGHRENDVSVVSQVYLCENTDHSAEHFTISPKEQLSCLLDSRKQNLELIGNWHSHPETPSRMSEEDKRIAVNRSWSYLILSLQDTAHPVLNAFRYSEEQQSFEQEPLQIQEER
ncbi:MAG: M67 family metallopeptidase [Solobacterium sp.]|nr:M67 family metallopeptidase [Solobacterium sp.]